MISLYSVFQKDEVLRTLPHDFRKSPIMTNILIIYRNQLLELANTFLEILGLSDIYNCFGVQLDVYGRNFGVHRNGNPDEVYRELILIKLTSLLSSGTIPEILETTSAILNLTSGEMALNEVYPAKIQLEIMKPSYVSGVQQIVSNIRAAGVGYTTEAALGDSFLINGNITYDMNYYNTEVNTFNRNLDFDDARYQTRDFGGIILERHSRGVFLSYGEGTGSQAIVGDFLCGDVTVGTI